MKSENAVTNVSAVFNENRKSARRDSNFILPRKAHKIKEECTLSTVCLQLV